MAGGKEPTEKEDGWFEEQLSEFLGSAAILQLTTYTVMGISFWHLQTFLSVGIMSCPVLAYLSCHMLRE